MKQNSPVVLIYPPPSDPTQPYTSLPTLTAHLRAHGFSVVQRDVGIEAFNHICTEKSLRSAFAQAQRLRVDALPEAHRKTFLARRSRLALAVEFLSHHIDTAAAVMRSQASFENLERYRWACRLMALACDVFSLPHHPTLLTPNNYLGDIDYSKEGIFRATTPGQSNAFHDYFKTEVIPSVLEQRPLLVGISVTYHFQMVPAFTLARMLKAAAPALQVVMGGAVLARMEDHLISDADWFDFADYFVVGEGETALLNLVESLAYDTPLGPTPNLIRRERGATVYGDTCFTEDFAHLPCPDYRGLDLEAYFSPEPVLLMPTTRGCYYGKCTFCDVSRQTRTVYRPLSRTDVAENLMTLHQRHGAKRFFLCDDAVPMKNMLEVARVVEESLPSATWQAEARLEKPMTREFMDAIYRGGCRELIFGFESASQRVLDLMHKHNKVETDQLILKACADAGIAVNLQTFIGLPGETAEEASSTIRYLLEHEHQIASIGFGTFSLYKDTPIYKDPERYQVTAISTPMEGNLLASLDFVPLSGMSRAEAEALHDDAIARFGEIYATRSVLLGGASGAHSLLQLSYLGYDKLYGRWRAVDDLGKASDWLEWIPDRSDCELSDSAQACCVFSQRSGVEVELGADERACFIACDGKSSIDDIASMLSSTTASPDFDVDAFATAATALRRLVCMQVLHLMPYRATAPAHQPSTAPHLHAA
ncbi:MAG: radical SAM protein [Pseudomonadota bacterium]